MSGLMNIVAIAVLLLSHPFVLEPGESYGFGGSVVLNDTLNMAVYGPIRSGANNCSDDNYRCINSDFIAISAPRYCSRNIGIDKKYTVGSLVFKVMGEFKYKGDLLFLVYEESHPNSVFGYNKRDGVRFVIIDPYERSDELNELFRASDNDENISDAMFNAEKKIIPADENQTMFSCS